MIFSDEIKKQIAETAIAHGLDFVALFGSQATGKTHQKSDIDIAVITRADLNLATLEMRLCDIMKRDDVQVVNLATASPTLMYAVCKDGVLLYEKTPSAYLNWKVYATKIWMDTAWLRRLRDKKLLEWSDRYSSSNPI